MLISKDELYFVILVDFTAAHLHWLLLRPDGTRFARVTNERTIMEVLSETDEKLYYIVPPEEQV